VQHIAQDKTGFLWISTWDGISRYDGYEFKNYYHKPNDSTTVPFFVVNNAVVDGSNNAWVMYHNRPAVIYNRNKDCFEKFRTDEFNELIIAALTSGPDSTIWMYSVQDATLYNFDSVKKILSKFRLVHENTQGSISFRFGTQLVIDNKGGVWMISIENREYKVFRGEILNNNTFKLHSMNSLPVNIIGDDSEFKLLPAYDILIDEDEKIILFSKFGLFYFDKAVNRFVETDSSVLSGARSGKPYYFWSDEESGIHVIDSIQNKESIINPGQGKFIENLFVDRQGTIWSADFTANRENIGLNRYTTTPSYFKYYLTGENKTDVNIGKHSNQIEASSCKWVAMRGLETVFQVFPDGSYRNFSIPTVNGKTPSVYSMVRDSLGLWLGCSDNCLIRFNFQNRKFTTHILQPQEKSEKPDMRIHNILNEGNYLIINAGIAIYKYNIDNRKLTAVYFHEPNMPCFSMVSDGNQGYWICVNNNTIKHLNPDFKETGTYRFDEGQNNVEHICLGDSSDVWVALMGGGLGHLYTKTGRMEVFTTENGLVNNTLLGIMKQKNGNLWISTNKGISMFNPTSRQFRNFGKSEGMLIEEFKSDAYFLASDGEMFFGGVGGMVSFYPESVEKYSLSQNSGNLLVTDFKVSGIPRYFNKPIYELDTVILDPGENNFQLTFSRLDFKNSEKIKYRYRLLGNNDLWAETDHRLRNINYSNLVPGSYNLEIEATNNFGDWDSAISLLVVISPFYYQTWWFKVLLILTIASVFAAGLVIYNRQIQLKAKQKQNELKLESLRGQMNPHFIFNALNSVNYFISNNDKISANSYISDFSRLIRSILNNLSYDFIPFEKELESIRDYLRLEHLRFSDKFNYELNIEIENPMQISVFPGLVQPIIENAIWHGIRGLEESTGRIKVTFKTVDRQSIKCIVEDDGIGRKQAEIHKNVLPGKKSRGIGIVSERLKIISEIRKIQYKLTFEDINPDIQETGTRATIDLPIEYHNLLIEKPE
jgi:streptogramin lyase